MQESAAYLIAVVQGSVDLLSGRSRQEQVRPILEKLNENGSPISQVQEIHWHGGDEAYWFGAQGETFGFAPEVARFHWPVTPLLTHVMLQSIARTIEARQRDLVLLVQETGGQAIALLLASQAAAERVSAAPQARIGLKLALSSTPSGLLQAARAAWEQAGRSPGDVKWLSSARRSAEVSQSPFPGARWLDTDNDTPSGDLFMLAALAKRLGEGGEGAGLLFSEGLTKSGLVTFLERE